MAFTYTDRTKTILHSWGRFKVTLLEAVVAGDLLSFYNTDNAYTVQFADQSDSQVADCIAVSPGAAGDEITACLKAEIRAPVTIATGGGATQTYFAASSDFFGAPLYLGEDGKPSSSAGGTYSQIVGRLLARDRILLDVGAAPLAGATFTGAVVLSSTLNVAGVATLAGVTIITGALYLGAGVNVTGAAVFNSGISVAGGINITGATVCNGGLSVAGAVDLQTVTVHSSIAIAAGGTLTIPQVTSATQLPAADPSVAGQLYVDAGTVKRSAG